MEKTEARANAQSNRDSLPAFKLLVSCPSGISPPQFSLKFDEAYDRILHPDSNLENSISEIWDQRTQRSKSLFNGQKFRYAGHDGHGSNQGHVCLHLGLTDYRTFVGTNLSPFWERFLVPSEDDSVCCQHTASPLGNGAIVETSDKRILVLKRSDDVGEFPGHFVFPGGHPECEPIFIGVSRRELNRRPTAMFSIKCTLESEKIQQLYSRAQDGYESTQLYAVSMIGCHQGGLALYKLMIEARKDIR